MVVPQNTSILSYNIDKAGSRQSYKNYLLCLANYFAGEKCVHYNTNLFYRRPTFLFSKYCLLFLLTILTILSFVYCLTGI